MPLACVLCLAGPWSTAQDRDAKLRALHEEIGRLEQEQVILERREGGVLDELERLSAELSLSQARLRERGRRH